MSHGPRIPPQALEVEASVLGSILLDPGALDRATDVLGEQTSDIFYRSQHQMIFDAMRELASRGEPVDLLTLSGALEGASQLATVGGMEYLTSLVEGVVSSGNIAYHAEILREKALLRRLIQTGGEIVEGAFDASLDADEQVDKAQSQLFEVARSRTGSSAVVVGEILKDTIRDLEERQASDSTITGIATGFHDLDRMTAGLQRGDLVILAARPSMGKTSFALNIAQYIGIELERPVAIFSMEMSKESLVARLLASEARVDSAKIRRGDLSSDDWFRISQATGFLDRAPIYIDDSSSLTPLELRSRCRALKTKYDIDLVLVDYLQLMHSPGKSENRQQEISHISRSVKGLAKEINAPIVALSQLSRAVESRGDKRPQLSDLRESGAIEQDADLVAFIHRPEMYDVDVSDLEGEAELIIGKQRNGPTGRVKLTFVKSYTRFENHASESSVPDF